MTKIRNQFAIYYFAIAILSITMMLTIYITYTGYFNDQLEETFIDMFLLEEDYRTGGLDYAYANQHFLEDDCIEILDSNYCILEAINSPNEIGYTYSQQEFDELNTQFSNMFLVKYLENSSGHLILAELSEYESDVNIIPRIATIAFFLTILVITLFALYTSRKIVNPIQTLDSGVKDIMNGNRGKTISFKSSNELANLRDAFNQLTLSLDKEIKLKEKAEQNNRTLIKNISHDIRTPLTNIIGYTKILQTHPNLSQEMKVSSQEIIVKNALLADTLLDELTEISLLNNTQNSMNLETIDFTNFLKELIIDYLPSFESKAIQCDIDLPDSMITLTLDKVQMTRALNNIIQNSIKYNPNNLHLKIKLEECNNEVILTISDNGIGIDPEYAEKIFESEYRMKNTSQLPGLGLGLSICKKIINAHNGTIYLDTEFMDGCRFVIKF